MLKKLFKRYSFMIAIVIFWSVVILIYCAIALQIYLDTYNLTILSIFAIIHGVVIYKKTLKWVKQPGTQIYLDHFRQEKIFITIALWLICGIALILKNKNIDSFIMFAVFYAITCLSLLTIIFVCQRIYNSKASVYRLNNVILITMYTLTNFSAGGLAIWYIIEV